MISRKVRGNGDGDVWPRKNRQGKITNYRGAYWVQTADGPKKCYVSGKTKAECRATITARRGSVEVELD